MKTFNHIMLFAIYMYNVVHIIITKTCLYNFDPLKPHFYIVTLGFTGVYIIFLISAQKHRLLYSLEPPRRGGSNEYLQSNFSRNMKNISFLFENYQFLVVKFSIYLNRRVFVMTCSAVDGASDRRLRGRKFKSQIGHITRVEIDHEIISTVFLTFPIFSKDSCQL